MYAVVAAVLTFLPSYFEKGLGFTRVLHLRSHKNSVPKQAQPIRRSRPSQTGLRSSFLRILPTAESGNG